MEETKTVVNNINEEILLEYLRGNLDPEKTHSVLEWIESDDANLEAFSQIKAIYNYLNMKGKLTKYEFHKALRRMNDAIDAEKPVLLRKRVQRIIATITSSLTVIVLCVLGIVHFADAASTFCIDTNNGKATNILLEDGTQVWLSPYSSISLNKKTFSRNREVSFEGEAVFDVTSNPSNPFIVKTDKVSIKVLGTEFKVRSYSTEDYSETTLARGLVELNTGSGVIALSPGQKVTVAGDKLKVEQVDCSEVEMMTYGIVSIVNASLERIIAHLEEDFGVSLQLVTKVQKDELYTFNYTVSSDISDIIVMLETIAGVSLEIK